MPSPLGQAPKSTCCPGALFLPGPRFKGEMAFGGRTTGRPFTLLALGWAGGAVSHLEHCPDPPRQALSGWANDPLPPFHQEGPGTPESHTRSRASAPRGPQPATANPGGGCGPCLPGEPWEGVSHLALHSSPSLPAGLGRVRAPGSCSSAAEQCDKLTECIR